MGSRGIGRHAVMWRARKRTSFIFPGHHSLSGFPFFSVHCVVSPCFFPKKHCYHKNKSTRLLLLLDWRRHYVLLCCFNRRIFDLWQKNSWKDIAFEHMFVEHVGTCKCSSTREGWRTRSRSSGGSSGPALTAANADAGAALAVQAQQTMQRNQLQQID